MYQNMYQVSIWVIFQLIQFHPTNRRSKKKNTAPKCWKTVPVLLMWFHPPGDLTDLTFDGLPEAIHPLCRVCKLVLQFSWSAWNLPSFTFWMLIYPLVNVYITMENHHAINGKTHYFYGQFQLLFWHNQRVVPKWWWPKSFSFSIFPKEKLTERTSRNNRKITH